MMAALAMESLFGPPSDSIDIPAFIKAAADAVSNSQESDESWQHISEQCSVADLRDSLTDAWNNPHLSAHLSKNHDYTVASLFPATKSARSKRKAQPLDPEGPETGTTILQNKLDNIKLQSWKLRADSTLFMRSSRTSDQNALAQVKPHSNSCFTLSSELQVIVSLTVYNKLAWGSGYVTRTSQHVLLSSQTLGDLFEVIPCTSNELTSTPDVRAGNRYVNDGCAICIEGALYGDGLSPEGYASKLMNHLQSISKDYTPITAAKTSIYDTPFSSLCLRINQPYWLLHQGNCEHFIVIDQIRLQHSSDSPSGYPLTIQITPSLLDLCRACGKVPAALSVFGDVRLGESPCLMCRPCWDNMGTPPDPSVAVISLPMYDLGW